jgi:hypothetical protein
MEVRMSDFSVKKISVTEIETNEQRVIEAWKIEGIKEREEGGAIITMRGAYMQPSNITERIEIAVKEKRGEINYKLGAAGCSTSF